MKKSMTKRFLALALGFCMVASSFAPVYASEAGISEVSAAAQEVKASGNLVGDPSFENADLTSKSGSNLT